MAPYYFVIFSTSLLSVLAQRQGSLGRPARGTAKALLGVIICILVSVAGLRYYVGTDYGAYYSLDGAFDLSERIKHFDEPGLALIQAVILWFTDDPAVAIFVYSAITIVLSLRISYRLTDEYLFFTLLFIFSGCWHVSFNGVRQCLAAAILFAGHRYIYNKCFWKYLITVFIASCFHISAVVMLLLYFILNNRFSFWNILALVGGTMLLTANYDTIFSFVGLLKDETVVLDVYATTTVNTLRVLVYCVPAVVVIILYSNNRPSREDTFYINALVVNAAAMLAASNSAYLARISIYTNLFTPIALCKLLKFKNRKQEIAIRMIVAVLYALFWYVEVSGSSSLSPFKWVFQR